MARIQIGGTYNQPGNTTKTYTMFAPIGFKIITAGFQSVGDGAHTLLASYPVIPNNTLIVGSSGSDLCSAGYADGSTPQPNPLEGWLWKVKNTDSGSHGFYMYLLVEESDEITFGSENYSWPVTAV